MENEWRKEMCALRDAIFHCPHCGAENFFDLELLRQKKTLDPCWGCRSALGNPPRMRVGAAYGSQLVMLSPGAQLFAHHLEGDTYNFGESAGRGRRRPAGAEEISLREPWTSRSQNGSMTEVNANEVLPLTADCQHPLREDRGRSPYQLGTACAILRHNSYTKPRLLRIVLARCQT